MPPYYPPNTSLRYGPPESLMTQPPTPTAPASGGSLIPGGRMGVGGYAGPAQAPPTQASGGSSPPWGLQYLWDLAQRAHESRVEKEMREKRPLPRAGFQDVPDDPDKPLWRHRGGYRGGGKVPTAEAIRRRRKKFTLRNHPNRIRDRTGEKWVGDEYADLKEKLRMEELEPGPVDATQPPTSPENPQPQPPVPPEASPGPASGGSSLPPPPGGIPTGGGMPGSASTAPGMSATGGPMTGPTARPAPVSPMQVRDQQALMEGQSTLRSGLRGGYGENQQVPYSMRNVHMKPELQRAKVSYDEALKNIRSQEPTDPLSILDAQSVLSEVEREEARRDQEELARLMSQFPSLRNIGMQRSTAGGPAY